MVYDHQTACHLGQHKTLANVRSRFYWQGITKMSRDDAEPVTYAQPRKISKLKHGKLKSYVVCIPIYRVAMDIIDPLPRSVKGNTYLDRLFPQVG